MVLISLNSENRQVLFTVRRHLQQYKYLRIESTPTYNTHTFRTTHRLARFFGPKDNPKNTFLNVLGTYLVFLCKCVRKYLRNFLLALINVDFSPAPTKFSKKMTPFESSSKRASFPKNYLTFSIASIHKFSHKSSSRNFAKCTQILLKY